MKSRREFLAQAGGVTAGSAALLMATTGPAQAGPTSSYPYFNVVSYGADPTGSTPSDAALAAAVTACGTRGGTIGFPQGTYTFASPIGLTGKTNIVLQGAGGTSAGGYCATSIIYTGSTGPFIDLSGAFGCSIRDCQMFTSNAGFSNNTYIKVGHLGSNDSFMCSLWNCTIGGATGTGIMHLALDGAINFSATGCVFNYGSPSILGQDPQGRNYSNRITFTGCQWNNSLAVPVYNGGQAWSFRGCTFEGLHNASGGAGAAGAFYSAAGTKVGGLVFEGCWFGDAATGTWVSVIGYGFRFSGNYVSAVPSTVTVGISLNSVQGFEIVANWFDSVYYVLSFDAPGNAAGVFKGNEFGSAYNKIINNPTNITGYFEANPNDPMVSSITGVQSFGPTGYEYSRNGLIKQWGVATVTTGTLARVNFPKIFNNLWGINLTLSNPSGGANTTYASATSTTGMSLNVAGVAGTNTVYWETTGN